MSYQQYSFITLSKILGLYRNKVFYEFHGAICSTNYKSYTCYFSQINKDQKEWIFYEDEDVIYYKGYIDLISNLVKTQQNPIFLIYQIQESFTTDFDKEFTTEEISRLEKLAKNVDSIKKSILL